MKIAVFSNCQGEGLALALEAMNPSVEAKFLISSDLHKDMEKFELLCESSDYLFIQQYVTDSIPQKYQHKIVYFPIIGFSAFHPDMTYLRGKRKDNGTLETIIGSMWSYHSSVAVFCYLHNISIDDAIGFYNHYVFSKLKHIDKWEESRQLLLEEGKAIDFPLETLLNAWQKRGCFMYSFNHPELKVMVDIAAELLKKIKVEIISSNPDRYLSDPLKTMPIWPVYPQIARRYGINGDFSFKRGNPDSIINLRQFVENAYTVYSCYEKESLEPLNFNMESYNQLLGFSSSLVEASKKKRSSNPYAGLPDVQFWKKSFPQPDISKVNPAIKPKFIVKLGEKIATAGSCFAQHIARTLSSNGFNYFITEFAPQELDNKTAYSKNYGIYSARYSNLYTARQLLQLFDRAYETFAPEDTFWTRKDGKVVDPFRPQIEPDGFESIEEAQTSREIHFSAVRKMFEEMEVFIFTLGLTEGWRSRHDGAVFPLAPGVAGGEIIEDRYEFVNFTVEEVTSDMELFLEKLYIINKNCKVILTVSPVPLIATYEYQHALVATTYSKSVLRVAADQLRKKYNHVEYFPSYEIITGTFNMGIYFDEDLRTVKEEGVSHVMRIFLENNTSKENSQGALPNTEIRQKTESNNLFSIVCDEEKIAQF